MEQSLISLLKNLLLYFSFLVSVASLTRGLVELKIYFLFEQQDENLIARIVAFITFGISSLLFILVKIWK